MVLSNDVFAYHTSHNSSVCYFKDGKIEWSLEEERVSRQKHDQRPYLTIAEYLKDVPGWILHSCLVYPDDIDAANKVMAFCNGLIFKMISKEKRIDKTPVFEDGELTVLCRTNESPNMMDCSNEHHLYHASIGFYNSGFEDAAVLIVDGAGAWTDKCAHEVETIYKASYPHSFEKLHKRAVPWQTLLDKHTISNPTSGIGMAYSGVSAFLGFGTLECGKLMGLASYGEDDPNIKPFLVDGQIDESLWKRNKHGVELLPYDYIADRSGWVEVLRKNETDPTKFQNLCNLAYRMQKDFETYMINLIHKALELSGSNNIVISGGCALNCVANYEYLKHLPEGVKLYVEPVSSDAGTAAGLAMYGWRNLTKSTEIYPLKDLYWGPQHEILL